MPTPISTLAVLNWPFTSELSLFLTLSSLSLIFIVLESLILKDEDANNLVDERVGTQNATSYTGAYGPTVLEVKSVFILSVFCLFAAVYLFSKILFTALFGRLSDGERSSLSRMLFKFVILRSVILSGAVVATHLTSVFGWLIWFSVLGILHSCALIATFRFSRFSASSRISSGDWFRVVSVLAFLYIANWCNFTYGLANCSLLADVDPSESPISAITHKRPFTGSSKAPTALGVLISRLNGKNEPVYDTVDVVTYIVAETVLLFCLTTHLTGNLLVQAYSRRRYSSGLSWSQETSFSYYLDFIHVITYHLVEMIHYLHLLLWSRIFSVASLVVFLHIRHVYSLLSNRIRRHLSYRRLSTYIRNNFVSCYATKSHNSVIDSDTPAKNMRTSDDSCDKKSSKDEVQESLDVCAICWEHMLIWKRLPCRHEFHESCLRSWLEQSSTCPTCRLDLHIPPSVIPPVNRSSQSNQVALGLILRNLIRHTENTNVPVPNFNTHPLPTTNRLATTGPTASQVSRNFFATAVGLNLGVSIGSGPIVTAAAQAVARDAVPSSSVVEPSSTPPQGTVTTNESSISQNVGDSDARIYSQESIQQPNVNNLAGPDESNQVRRRSFHFDGSRYFSWLPSLHVELSEVIREVFSTGTVDFHVPPAITDGALLSENGLAADDSTETPHSTLTYDPNAYELIRLPMHLRGPAQEIAAIFPQISLSVIVSDLLLTGVPEATVDNLIQRPAPSTSEQISPQSSGLRDLQTHTRDEIPTTHIPSSSSIPSAGPLTRDPVRPLSTNPSLDERRKVMLDKARNRFLATNSHQKFD